MFISMILVAAVAAGVLFGVAEDLQSQAEATGEESTAKVSNDINVLTTVGHVDTETNTIETVDITVGLQPGSSPMDLENFVLEYVGPGGQTYFHNNDLAIAIDGERGTVLEQINDRGTITITLGSDTDPLEAGDDASLVIVTNEGAQTTERLAVPTDLNGTQSTRL
jgi:archaellin